MPAGSTFKDCDLCPEMVVLPMLDTVKMGVHPLQKKSPYDDQWHDEKIDYRFAVGKFELRWEEYAACVTDGACSKANNRVNPVILQGLPAYDLQWDQANDYVKWLANKTGKPYRLLSHSEWEYAARGGTDTVYWWGDDFRKDMAVCEGCSSLIGRSTGTAVYDGRVLSFSLKAGHYINPVGGPNVVPPNPFGLYFMAGNVQEWVADCFHPNGGTRPTDGSAWIEGGDCSQRVVMGNDFKDFASDLKLGKWAIVKRNARPIEIRNIGTRVALSLD